MCVRARALQRLPQKSRALRSLRSSVTSFAESARVRRDSRERNFSFPAPNEQRERFSFLERGASASSAIWRARDGSTATCQLLINISLITIEIPPRLPPPSAIIRYPPVNNLYTGVSDVFCWPAFIIAPIGNNSMILC